MQSRKMKVTQVSIDQAKIRLSQLAELVWLGERVIIIEEGKPYLDLKPHFGRFGPRTPGRYKGEIELAEDFEDTPAGLAGDFEGER